MPLKINKKPKPKASIPKRGIKAAKLDIAQTSGALIITDSVLEHAKERLRQLGLSTAPRPTDADGNPIELDFPQDLSRLTSDELARYLGYYTAMEDYAGGQLALLDAAHLVEKYNDKIQGTISMLESNEKTKYERDAQAKLDPAASAQALAYYTRVAEFKLLVAVHSGYSEKKKAISREISRRDTLVTAKLST